MSESYFDATDESAVQLFSRNFTGAVVMLNLLRFREVADYSTCPELAPGQSISGREAFQRYIDHTLSLEVYKDQRITSQGSEDDLPVVSA